MFLYSLKRTKIELLRADSQLQPLTLGTQSARHVEDAARVIRVSSRFFVDKVDGTAAGRTVPRRAPTIYRDASTQLLRCLYREILVRFKTRVPASKRRAHVADLGLEVVRSGNSPHQVIVRDPSDRRQGDDLVQLANTLAERDDEIVYAAPNFISEYRRTAPPVIPVTQWHLNNTGVLFGQVAGQDIGAQGAWPIAQGLNIVVAILDDGIDLDHPALQSQLWRNPDSSAPDQYGRDYFLDPSDPGFNNPRPKVFNSPFNDALHNDIHGTPCAGLVAAAALDARAFGVAPQCKILPVKIFHGSELASDAFIANAFSYAAGIADILSCSWHGPSSPAVEHAITSAAATGRGGKGCAIFCSVGDESSGTVCFPASLPIAIGVGASTDKGLPALYSNSGPEVAIVAPSDGGAQISSPATSPCPASATTLGKPPSAVLTVSTQMVLEAPRRRFPSPLVLQLFFSLIGPVSPRSSSSAFCSTPQTRSSPTSMRTVTAISLDLEKSTSLPHCTQSSPVFGNFRSSKFQGELS